MLNTHYLLLFMLVLAGLMPTLVGAQGEREVKGEQESNMVLRFPQGLTVPEEMKANLPSEKQMTISRLNVEQASWQTAYGFNVAFFTFHCVYWNTYPPYNCVITVPEPHWGSFFSGYNGSQQYFSGWSAPSNAIAGFNWWGGGSNILLVDKTWAFLCYNCSDRSSPQYYNAYMQGVYAPTEDSTDTEVEPLMFFLDDEAKNYRLINSSTKIEEPPSVISNSVFVYDFTNSDEAIMVFQKLGGNKNTKHLTQSVKGKAGNTIYFYAQVNGKRLTLVIADGFDPEAVHQVLSKKQEQLQASITIEQ